MLLFLSKYKLIVKYSFIIAIALILFSLNDSKELTKEEKQWLNQHKEILFAPDPEFPPFEYFDKNGKFSGITSDYTKLMEQRLGLKFKIIHYNSWDEIVENAKRYKIDISGCVQKSIEREKFWNFTKPHTSASIVVLNHIQDTSVKKLKNLEYKTIATVKNYIITESLKKDRYPFILKEYKTPKEAFKALENKEVYAMIIDNPIANYYIKTKKVKNLKISFTLNYSFNYAFAVRNDEPVLLSIMEKALASISDKEKEKIYQKWIKETENKNTLPNSVWGIVLIIFGVISFSLLLVILWIKFLKK